MSASFQDLISPTPRLDGLARRAARARDHLALARPRVLALVLFTATPVFALGRSSWPEASLMAGVLAGSALIGAACSAFNAWIERDRDRLMERTRDRPLPAGRLAPRDALAFGLLTSLVGLWILMRVGGWPPALVGLLTLAHYVGVYTVWLKPRSASNIVIGGAAGAASPLIADAALDGRIGPWGLVLFAIVFLWTPPHFWAIALYRKREYAAAGFPMLPQVAGDRAARRRQLAYALVLIPVSLLPWIGGALGAPYALAACALGAAFVASIARAMGAESARADRRVFLVSLVYLAGLFAAMLIELLVG